MGEVDPFGEPSFYELLTPEQEAVCREAGERCFHVTVVIELWHLGGSAVEIDCLRSTTEFVNFCRDEQETIDSLPPLGYYEPGLTIGTLLRRIRAELPFSDEEFVLVAQARAKWDDEIAVWRESPSEEEGELIARWHDWLREPGTDDDPPEPKIARRVCPQTSASAKRAWDSCDKVIRGLATLLPPAPSS